MNVEILKQELIHDEGLVSHAYQDHLGFWTIGVGRLIDERRGGGITKEEAEYLLENDIGRVTIALRKKIKGFDLLSDTRQRALINMAFQLGVNGLMGFGRMLWAIERGDFDMAYVEALDSKWAHQTPKRAKRVSEMIKHG